MGFRCLTHLGPWENLHPGLVLAPCIAIGVNFSTANAFHCSFVCCRYREAIKKPRVLKSITIDQFTDTGLTQALRVACSYCCCCCEASFISHWENCVLVHIAQNGHLPAGRRYRTAWPCWVKAPVLQLDSNSWIFNPTLYSPSAWSKCEIGAAFPLPPEI